MILITFLKEGLLIIFLKDVYVLKVTWQKKFVLNYCVISEVLFFVNLCFYPSTGPGPVRPPVKEGLLSPPPRRPFPPRRGGMRMQAPRPFLPPRPPAMEGAHVIMVYGLHESKMNCDRLFNVLCCYGNVLKVRQESILQSKNCRCVARG